MILQTSLKCNYIPSQVLLSVFLLQLLKLCIGVSIERQKVMIGGVTLSNDDWGKTRPKIKEVSSMHAMIEYIELN